MDRKLNDDYTYSQNIDFFFPSRFETAGLGAFSAAIPKCQSLTSWERDSKIMFSYLSNRSFNVVVCRDSEYIFPSLYITLTIKD